MFLKGKLLKAAAICNFVFTALWFVVTACFFALSDNLYWLFLVFALISIYDGFVLISVKEKMHSVALDKNENIKLLVCWILSIVCLPSFILCGLAYFRKTEDEVTVRGNVAAEEKEEVKKAPVGKKPFYKAKSFITMCVAFGMIIISSFTAMCFETSGFSVEVSDFTLTREMTLSYNEGKIHGKQYAIPLTVTDDGKEHETTYSVTMYKPDSATEEKPAPVVFVLPGFTRTKATMAQYCIELSRRGAVVFCSDPGGQGGTTENSSTGAHGIEYLVQYVYNNSDDFKFCDKNRFGAVGHSQGGGNVVTLASDMAGASFEESIIKSVYNSGYIKTSAANKFKNFNCNAAMSYAYYDEGAYRYQSDATAFEVIGLRFINEVNGAPNTFDKIAYDYGYGDMSKGTYRIVHRENINHCFEMYDKVSIANTIDYFNETLDIGSDIGGLSQIWFGKEFSNGLALAAAFTFVLSLCGVLMRIPFFATLKNANIKNAEATDGMVTVADEKPALPVGGRHKTVAHKVIFWSCILLTAIIACLDYIPLANLSIEIFPTSNLASVYTFTFPARMINAILLWAAINGLSLIHI